VAAGAKILVSLWANTHQTEEDTDIITLTFDLWGQSHMSVMWVIVLHPYTKFAVCRPSHSEDMAYFLSQH